MNRFARRSRPQRIQSPIPQSDLPHRELAPHQSSHHRSQRGRYPSHQHQAWLVLLRGLAIATVLGWGIVEFSPFAETAQANRTAKPAEAPPPHPWAGASFPVHNFTAYTSAFGWRQHPYGGRRFHYGLDLAAPMGSYVVSWWDGTVTRVAEDSACGTYAIIQSGAWSHVYCHMLGGVVVEKDGDRFLVDRQGGIQLQQGSTVQAGSQIGRVGMSGSATGPHLHWGLKYQGSWVDPALVIRAMAAQQNLP